MFPKLELAILQPDLGLGDDSDIIEDTAGGNICKSDPSWVTEDGYHCKDYALPGYTCDDVGKLVSGTEMSASEACPIECQTCPPDIRIKRNANMYNRLPTPIDGAPVPNYEMILKDPEWAMGSDITDVATMGRDGNLEKQITELEEKVDDIRMSMPNLRCMCADISGNKEVREGQADRLAPIRCGNVSEMLEWGEVETWTNQQSKDTDVRYKVRCKKGDYKTANGDLLKDKELVYNCTAQTWETRKADSRFAEFKPFDFAKDKQTMIKCLSDDEQPQEGVPNFPQGCVCREEGPNKGKASDVCTKTPEVKAFTQTWKVGADPGQHKGWYLYNKGIPHCNYNENNRDANKTNIVKSYHSLLDDTKYPDRISTDQTIDGTYTKDGAILNYKTPFEDTKMYRCGSKEIPKGSTLHLNFYGENYDLLCAKDDPLNDPIVPDPTHIGSTEEWLKLYACYLGLTIVALGVSYLSSPEDSSIVFKIKAASLVLVLPALIWFLYSSNIADDKKSDLGQTTLRIAWTVTLIGALFLYLVLRNFKLESKKFNKFTDTIRNVVMGGAIVIALVGVARAFMTEAKSIVTPDPDDGSDGNNV